MINEDHNSSIYDINKWVYFGLICLLTFLMLVVKKSFIENQTAAFEILEQRGEMGLFHLINGLQYLSIPIIYLYKFTIISFVIWIGCFMFGYKVTYSQSWHVTLVSETIFFIPEILKIVWFTFIDTDVNLYEIRGFYPLSLIHFYDIYELPAKWFYPLKALNVFEITYWFLLVNGIDYMANKRRSTAYYIVFSSYVFLFIIWLGFYLIVYK